jgi:hypothetical protein
VADRQLLHWEGLINDFFGRAVAGWVVCWLIAQSAVAQLDQQNIVPPHFSQITGLVVSQSYFPAQTFTVSRTGKLTEVDLGIFDFLSGPGLTVSIVRTTGGLPDFTPGGVLATKSIPDALIPTLPENAVFNPYFSLSIDFSSNNLHVDVGDVLAIELQSSASDD